MSVTPELVQVAGPLPPPPGTAASAQPHILLAVDELARTLGGGERVLLRLARELPGYGFRVSILTLALDPATPALANLPCPLYLLPIRRTWDLHALQAARGLRRFLRAERVALVQTFFESSDLWVGPVARTVPGIRLIWSRRDLGILRGAKHRLLYRLLRRLPDRVLAVSEQVRQHAIQVDGLPPDRVETLHNGIDLPSAADTPGRLPAQVPLHITSVGNVRHVKGFDLLIEAAAEVVCAVPEVRFTIAGGLLDAGYATQLQGRADELGLTDVVQFLGNVTDVPAHLRTAGLFCLPSRSEGLSNALLEAMAAGLPSVATDVGGNAECVEDGVSGLVVPPEDAAALAKALIRLAQDPVLRARMGQAARDRVVSRFSTAAMLRATTVAYCRVLPADVVTGIAVQ